VALAFAAATSSRTKRLEREAEQYGAAGGRPQVVWPNGVLASTAVGIVLELLTPWHRARFIYMEYDGNRRTVSPSHWMTALEHRECPHYQPAETGDPDFDVRRRDVAMADGRSTVSASVIENN